MRSLKYLYLTSAKNRIRKALMRPVTYIAGIFVLLYVWMIVFGFGTIFNNMGINSRETIAAGLSALMFMLIPVNIISYVRRKGLLYRPSDTHFVFPAPENPKMVILFAGIKSILLGLAVGIFVVIVGVTFCHVPLWRMLLYFLFAEILENIMEGALMVICYGNETLPERFFKVLTGVLYLMLAVFVAVAAYLLSTKGVSMSVITEYMTMPVIQLVPLFGWEVAAIHFILVGPTAVNSVGTLLFVLMTVGLVFYAVKMRCSGEYYEDAAKFADEYALKMKRAKKGEMNVGKRKYVRRASVEYKGRYAKAIYYRQLLEYRKNRFFIFGWNSLAFLVLGVIIAVVGYFNSFAELPGKIFIVPGVVAYAMFIFSGYITRWEKELMNPYTYMIPDSNFKKLWYSTKIEHIRAVVDGCLITLPAAVTLLLPPVYVILTVLFYVCLAANKLYMNMLADAVLGARLGNTGKSLLRAALQGIVMMFGLVAAIICGMLISVPAGFFVMSLVVAGLTLAGAVLASFSFAKMEALD